MSLSIEAIEALANRLLAAQDNAQPIAQVTALPSVLPTVATVITGQNMAGFSLIKPNTTGSEPSGSNVAEMNDTTNTVLRPNSGSASKASRLKTKKRPMPLGCKGRLGFWGRGFSGHGANPQQPDHQHVEHDQSLPHIQVRKLKGLVIPLP